LEDGMGASEFETLRADLASMRANIDALRVNIDTVRGDIDIMRGDIDTRLIRLEAKIDEKPGYAALYQVAFGAPIALVGFTAAVMGIAKALGQI
jgi:hypothetical protein